MRLTAKQGALLKVISNANPDGSFVDLDQAIARLPYKTSKASLQFSIRALVKHGLANKAGSDLRRDRRHTTLMLTPAGLKSVAELAMIPVAIPVSMAISEEVDALEAEIEELLQ